MDGSQKPEYIILESVLDELWPLCRSITGPGLEKSLAIMGKHIPLNIEKVPSGSKVFDWTVPPEWHFESALLTGPDGEIICDASRSNLEVVNYSEPVKTELGLDQLLPHLHSLPNVPEAIPYVTSYYNRTWGFCLPHSRKTQLKQGTYKVEIVSDFKESGGVPFGQTLLAGESDREILLTSYLCHPSLANNELSGPLVMLGLYNRLSKWPKRRFSYRFLLNPETIGSLCFLSRYYNRLRDKLEAGLILTCMGGPVEKLRYKSSRRADSIFDKLAAHYAEQDSWALESFTPLYGSDERQYCAPGFNLPMGQVARTIHGDYEGYHNSLDTKEFMDVEQVIKSIDEVEALLQDAEIAGNPVNLSPFGEPQLGNRGLYPNINSGSSWGFSNDNLVDGRTLLNWILTLLSKADGKTSLLNIARELDCSLNDLRPVVERLEAEKLLAYNVSFPTLD